VVNDGAYPIAQAHGTVGRC